MKKISALIFISTFLLILSAFIPNNRNNSSNYLKKTVSQKSGISKILYSNDAEKRGAYFSGIYPDLFSNLLGKYKNQVNEKINNAFNQLYYGNDSTQRVYYTV